MTLKDGTPLCPNCKAFHDGKFLPKLAPGEKCPIQMGRPCLCCGEPVTALSMGGNTICGYCDAGHCLPCPGLRCFCGGDKEKCTRKPRTEKCTEHFQESMKRFYALYRPRIIP